MYNTSQIAVLREITSAAENLHNDLDCLREQATQALRKMEQGLNFGGFGGPISNQTPFDIERYAERLQGWIRTAKVLKVEDEHILMAHEMGTCALASPRREELWQAISALADSKVTTHPGRGNTSRGPNPGRNRT